MYKLAVKPSRGILYMFLSLRNVWADHSSHMFSMICRGSEIIIILQHIVNCPQTQNLLDPLVLMEIVAKFASTPCLRFATSLTLFFT